LVNYYIYIGICFIQITVTLGKSETNLLNT